MNKLSFVLFVFVVFLSCKDEKQLEKQIAEIDVNVIIERFDLAFAKTDAANLPNLKKTFPFMFSRHIPDSIWVAQINDTLQQELSSEVEKQFIDIKDVENEIRSLFKHLKYYDPTFSEPRVVTTTSFVDYRNNVFVSDTVAVIALDTYLGAQHEFYGDIPNYITKNMHRSNIVTDLADAYADHYIFQSQRKTLLDEMVYYGKKLYFKDKVIPFKTDAEKMEYTPEEITWAIANESEIWSYFIERELLYSTDNALPSRFIANAPFSKFYLELDNESPGRLGQFIGWQIVRAYMAKNDVDFMDMMRKDAEEIFNNSKYKPRK
ncbi:MAG TPA: gliding motility lipoprotein GldB [Aquaticitalea sp.]|nr:gliding motility lipoprotein GldB [Aquaticitalea sp.]HNU60040.1 gliding motility lipoprotein GldB [Aquaticitalea sp.]